MNFPRILFLAVLFAALASLRAASPALDPELIKKVTELDAKTFAAFNRHDVDALMAMFTPDVEFYDDREGLNNSAEVRQGFAQMFAGAPDLRRELVAGSLRIFPLKDFGAIEMGTHRFCHQENGKQDCGEFPFLMIWKKTGDDWKMSRVIS